MLRQLESLAQSMVIDAEVCSEMEQVTPTQRYYLNTTLTQLFARFGIKRDLVRGRTQKHLKMEILYMKGETCEGM